MGLLDCCQCISFFGIFFYIAMGMIILNQTQFLKFKPEDSGASAGACFITALLEFLIVVGITVYQKWKHGKKDENENYYDFRSERQIRRQPSFKEIAMGDLKLMRQDQNVDRL